MKGPSTVLSIEVVQPSGAPPELTFFSALLPKPLEKGKILHLDVLTVFTHSLQPFPEEITQAEAQLVVYQVVLIICHLTLLRYRHLLSDCPAEGLNHTQGIQVQNLWIQN